MSLSGLFELTSVCAAAATLILGIAAVASPAGSARAFVCTTFAVTAAILMIVFIWLYYAVVGS